MTSTTGEEAIAFDDGDAYERFMGSWSRAAGAEFLRWVDPPADSCWLEVGCGTGAFTALLLSTCRPVRIDAIDLAAELLASARRRLPDPRIHFTLGGAESLPYTASSFDMVASALVLNFVGDQVRALDEMRRTARSGATVAAYVWDFAGGRAPNSWLARGLESLGMRTSGVPGAASSSLGALARNFEAAGLTSVGTTSFDVALEFDDFDSFWRLHTPAFSPLAKAVDMLEPEIQASLRASLRAVMVARSGSVSWSARANAVKARVP